MPGALKNALEWTVSTTVFSDKPAAIIIAAASGEKAFASLDLILKTIGAKIGDQSKLIIKGAKGKINAASEITDQPTLQGITELMKAFMETIR